jgi:TorA maturation chaperone TorD
MDASSLDKIGISSSLYAVLASCLSGEPSRKTLAALKKDLTSLYKQRDGWKEPDIWVKVRDLKDSLKDFSTEEAVVDYAALFLGAAENSVCPSESCYLDHMLYGPATQEVMKAYAERGFIKEASFREPDDHVAVEFLFRFLLGRDLAGTMDDDGNGSPDFTEHLRAYLHFVGNHLMKWIPLLSERIEASAQTRFYRTVASLARTLVREDYRLLAGLVKSQPSGPE